MTPCKVEQALRGTSYKKKKHKKIRAYRKSVQKDPTVKRCLFFSRIRATKIGQRNAFYWQRILESSCVRKETIEIDILVTSMNGGRKILQSIRIASIPPLGIRKWNQSNHFR